KAEQGGCVTADECHVDVLLRSWGRAWPGGCARERTHRPSAVGGGLLLLGVAQCGLLRLAEGVDDRVEGGRVLALPVADEALAVVAHPLRAVELAGEEVTDAVD